MKVSSVACKMLIWNVWSVANSEKLNNLLQIMDDKQVGIACITETWFDRKNGPFTKSIKDAGFDIQHAFRDDKRGGGTAVIYRLDLSVKKGEASSSDFLSFEFSYVTLTLNLGRKLMIVSLYRNQEISFKLFHEELALFMDKIIDKGYCVLIVGDFNVWAEEEENNDSTMLIDYTKWKN